jgi:hypothetical protein
MSVGLLQPTLFPGKYFDPIDEHLAIKISRQYVGAKVRVVTHESLLDPTCRRDNGAVTGTLKALESPHTTLDGSTRDSYILVVLRMFPTYVLPAFIDVQHVLDFGVIRPAPLRCEDCGRITPPEILELRPLELGDSPEFPRYRHRSYKACTQR